MSIPSFSTPSHHLRPHLVSYPLNKHELCLLYVRCCYTAQWKYKNKGDNIVLQRLNCWRVRERHQVSVSWRPWHGSKSRYRNSKGTPRRECSTLAYHEGLCDEDDARGGIVQGNYSKQRLQVFWVAGGKWNALPLLFVSSLITRFTKHFGALLSSLVSPEWSVSIRNQALGLRFALKTYQMVVLPSWWNGAFPRGEVEDECLGLVMHDLSS